MDRDRRWDRIQRAYDAMVYGQGDRAGKAVAAIQLNYDRNVTDEFIPPTVITGADGEATVIQPGDAVIFFNFRADRARQLTEALASPTFSGFRRGVALPNLFVATMARYEVGLPVAVAFPPNDVERPLARVISEAGLTQFHSAETEKYAHVTFFLNGGREEPFPGEDRALVPSPRVATYDLQPEMSAAGVTARTVEAIASGRYAFVIVNFANPDMVGHTGDIVAAVRAVETVDACLGQIMVATLTAGGRLLVTADHGNAETMIDPVSGQPMTAHTTNPVPVVLVCPESDPCRRAGLRPDARLSAVASTVLALLGLPVPPEMTEPPLLLPT
jgi:2,3-bisphosphoglycerate-independent phosphoglycerate mutase